MNSRLDFSSVPVIDAHCHSYLETPKTLSGEDFARNASLSAQPGFLAGTTTRKIQERIGLDRLSTMYKEQPYLRYMVHHLSKFFKCENRLDVVCQIRSERAERDLKGYVKDLFLDAGIRALVMDGGYPRLAEGELGQFPATVVKIFRIETFLKDLLQGEKDFDGLCNAFDNGVREAIRSGGFVGLKSIIAYRTGLKVQRVERVDAKDDFERAKSGRAEQAWFGPKVKKLRDFFIVRALELSLELNVPMQIHTGAGDYDIVLDQSDPALLYDLLKDDELRHATVVLVHSGFPNNPNAAYMAAMLPNVFLDFSLTIPLLNPISHHRLTEILEVAPPSKVMYGSDAFNLPEMIWFGAKVAKTALSRSLGILVEADLYTEEEAAKVGRRILFENANALYGVGIN